MASRTSQLAVWCTEESLWSSLDELGIALTALAWCRDRSPPFIDGMLASAIEEFGPTPLAPSS